MRVLHTSDWHLGRSFHGVDIGDHQRHFVTWLVDLVAQESIDLVVIAGDIYDRAVPSLPAVNLWQEAVVGLTRTCPVLVTSGNHDSPTRLGFAGPLLAQSGLHLRTSLDTINNPLVIEGADGVTLAAYGIPYLEPDLHREALGAERSHTAVLNSAMDRVRTDLESRPGVRSLVAAHAFITGAGDELVTSDSERDLRVGGVGDAPSAVFSGADVVTLGHLHGAQQVRSAGDSTVLYSGSPIAFSFSEEAQVKSVTIVDIPEAGPVEFSRVETPVPRPLVTLTGELETLLADPATAELADHWVRVRLTDARRPDHPMDRLRGLLPHTVELTFDGGLPTAGRQDSSMVVSPTDPLSLAEQFVEHVTSTTVDDAERELLRAAVERVRVEQVPQ